MKLGSQQLVKIVTILELRLKNGLIFYKQKA